MTRMLPLRSSLIHDFKNQLGIVLGFSEPLLADLADTDPRKADPMHTSQR